MKLRKNETTTHYIARMNRTRNIIIAIGTILVVVVLVGLRVKLATSTSTVTNGNRYIIEDEPITIVCTVGGKEESFPAVEYSISANGTVTFVTDDGHTIISSNYTIFVDEPYYDK